MISQDDLILLVYLVGISVFFADSLHYFLLGYGKKAIQAGFSTSLMFFGLILLIFSIFPIISAPFQISNYSIFALGFAITAFGYNGASNLEHSRKTDEIFMHIINKSNEIRYKNNLSFDDGKIFSAGIMVWGGAIAIVTFLASNFFSMCFGIIIICFGIGFFLWNCKKRPLNVDIALCQTVLKQLNDSNLQLSCMDEEKDVKVQRRIFFVGLIFAVFT